ncbi:unnamed protein product [Didymodactylos carnosus]|uniref:Uncharacterized protein n=1 Tax=Didymodactylos carnosus TaxID=1234261 RepID=A0A814HJG8_9BILA|nr:unnamed protein product [Didymodactylos carnosus]CAF3783032.1 unnamed protein product [Didymodactylos carnosus]
MGITLKSRLCVLIVIILIISVISIVVSAWLAKTITNTPTKFGTIIGNIVFGNKTDVEQPIIFWQPISLSNAETSVERTFQISNDVSNSTNNFHNVTTRSTQRNVVSEKIRTIFETVIIPILFVLSIAFGILAFYLRLRCTGKFVFSKFPVVYNGLLVYFVAISFAWGAVPKMPLLKIAEPDKQGENQIDFRIIQGTQDKPVVFSLAETLRPLKGEEGIEESTQYETKDTPRIITSISSAPQLPTIENNGSANEFDELLQKMSPKHHFKSTIHADNTNNV